MTKSELIDNIAIKQTQLSSKDVELAVKSILEYMSQFLSEGGRIEIRGFGVLEVKNTKPKPAARNPRTGEIVYVPARRKTHFKPGKQLKEALHGVTSEVGNNHISQYSTYF